MSEKDPRRVYGKIPVSGQTSKLPSKNTGAIVPVPHPTYPVRPPSTQFQVIGQIPKPYSSALASQPKPFDPFENPAQSQLQKPSQPRPRADYIPNYEVNLFYIEPSMKPQDNPVNLATQFFPPGWHFTPFSPHKSLSFYKDILIQTESVSIKPIFDRDDDTKIIFHSLHIKRIISISDWNSKFKCSHPSDLCPLTNASNPLLTVDESYFNYYDYMEAWHKIFLYQNASFSHSWFLQFDHKFKSQIPIWFTLWWSRYGPISEIFPDLLLTQVNHFSNHSPYNPNYEGIPILLRFSSKYKIPWIVKWQYNLPPSSQPPVVTRMFFIKWWDKFDVPRIVNQVQKEFPLSPVTPIKTIPAQGSSSKLKHKHSSPSPSLSGTIDVSGVKNYSSAELKLLTQAIRARASTLRDEVSNSSSSTSKSSQQSSSSINKDPYGTVNLQDAQDPFA